MCFLATLNKWTTHSIDVQNRKSLNLTKISGSTLEE